MTLTIAMVRVSRAEKSVTSFDAYLAIKVLHVASVVLFLGNIVTGLFWKAFADATRDPAIQAHALAGVIRSDAIFTVPGVVVITASGVALAVIGELPLLRTQWIAASIVAFALSGILFAAVVGPLQKRLLEIVRQANSESEWPSASYRRLSLVWEVSGALAILLPAAAMVMMIFKPESFGF